MRRLTFQIEKSYGEPLKIECGETLCLECRGLEEFAQRCSMFGGELERATSGYPGWLRGQRCLSRFGTGPKERTPDEERELMREALCQARENVLRMICPCCGYSRSVMPPEMGCRPGCLWNEVEALLPPREKKIAPPLAP